ncbi:MBL fold metallo-hydrolase [Dactylosporangium sp. McL0621]|uniref:MBL fold metallo-hydrolase n=1 Tax=Dactylosporangium sp. McL0621 TaxID=3415678 RepID=UPI003CEEE3CE
MDVTELLPARLYVLGFPVGQVYLWRGDDGLTLVDTGLPGSAPAIAAALRGLGHRPGDVRRVLLTHHHVDHAGSAAEIAGWGEVTVHAHAADAPVVRGAASGAPIRFAGDWERALYEQVHADLPDVPAPPVEVVRELGDGDVIDLGGEEAVALAAPGHTAGSVAFHLPGARVLFTGDAIARAPGGEVMLGVFNADPAAAAVAMRRQLELDVRVTCFGHGAPLVT